MSNYSTFDTFEELVKDRRKSNSSALIDNAAWDHALTLFYNMLEVASDKEKSVRIITGSMNRDFYCDSGITDRLKKIMGENIAIEIIVANDPAMDLNLHPCASMIDAYEHGKILIAKPAIASPHMLLIGDDASCFRFEVDHTQAKAKASFNNSILGSSLNELYETTRSIISSSDNGNLQEAA
ncbi:MAG: hypothetical protein Q9M20_00950 [Mariprofundaceae bacterium]|nr:hypothetical protein [Mariprofundaceae bacterium]